jgi:hypothetical protein
MLAVLRGLDRIVEMLLIMNIVEIDAEDCSRFNAKMGAEFKWAYQHLKAASRCTEESGQRSS